MYKESTVECEACSDSLMDGDILYCEDCYKKIVDEKEELIERIEQLEKQLKEENK